MDNKKKGLPIDTIFLSHALIKDLYSITIQILALMNWYLYCVYCLWIILGAKTLWYIVFIWSILLPRYNGTLRSSQLHGMVAGADSGGGGGRTRRAPPPKLVKICFFGVKSWFFTWNTPNIFAPPSARRNVFKCAPPPPNLKSWIRPWVV